MNIEESSREDTERRQPSVSQEGELTRNWTLSNLDLGPPRLQNGEKNKCLLFKPPSLQQCFMAARADEISVLAINTQPELLVFDVELLIRLKKT